MAYTRSSNLVSFIVSNYNNENYICECLDSILNQTYNNIEIIIVDDNSTDNSLNIINEWINKNKSKLINENSVHLISLPRNVGFSGAVTFGLYLAKGEFIAMQDGDDKSAFNRIEEQIKFLQQHPELGSVGSNYSAFNSTNPIPITIENGLVYGVNKIKDLYSSGINCISNGTLLIRGSVFDTIGGLTRKIPGAEDYEFITKLIAFGVDNIDQELYYYRTHENQRSKQFYSTTNNVSDKKELKVLMVLDSLNIGGTETHVLSLIQELITKEVSICLLADHGPLSESFMQLNCTLYNLDFPLQVIKDINTETRYKRKIKQIVLTEKINIIHCHQSPSGALCIDVARELNIPCFFTIHGLYYYDILFDKLSLCDKIISVSQPAYDWLLEYNIPSTIIPNSINFDSFLSTTNNSDIRKDLGISPDSFTIVYCSRIAWGKTKVAENLLRVCRDLIRLEKLDLSLIILGDGPDFNKLSAIANRINSLLNKTYIYLVGAKTNVVDYYLAADCIVGTGRVAIESIACKKPVIASGNNGYFGLLTCNNIEDAWRVYFGDHKSSKSNNASFLYNDLKDIYTNKENSIKCGTSCYEWAHSFFDIETNINKLIELYLTSITIKNQL